MIMQLCKVIRPPLNDIIQVFTHFISISRHQKGLNMENQINKVDWRSDHSSTL